MKSGDLNGGGLYAEDLTWREQEVLMLLAERLTNREIADRLHLAESTVKDYVGNILSKLYVKNRRQAVERAKVLGLLEPEGKKSPRRLTNLPAERTPFVGRAAELNQIRQCLGEARLLTLTGPGGIGKTRLGLKAAETVANDFEDGCFFISLAPLRSVDRIIQTVAEALKYPLATHEEPKYQLLRYLRNKRLLLVMDNFEHLLEGGVIVSDILQAAPAIRILTTSRERLNLQGETTLYVDGLSSADQLTCMDPLTNDAVNLFLQTGRRVRPSYEPSPNELEQIAQICQIVDGMPLAIELAAGWLNFLNPVEIARELESGLDILASDARDLPERHRSIHAVFEHSWSLLDPAEQDIFMRLSVFRGGFSREAAQRVTGATLWQLAGLVDKSLLSLDPDTGRMGIHELLRQYAQEQLEKVPNASRDAQEAHAGFYADFMQQRWLDMKGRRQLPAIAEVEIDIENIRAALQHYLEQGSASQISKFIKGMWYIHYVRGWYHAGTVLFAEVDCSLEGMDDEGSLTVAALATAFQAFFMGWLDLAERGHELASQSVDTLLQLDDPKALAFGYFSLALNAYLRGHYLDEINASDNMHTLVKKIDDPWQMAFTLFAVSMGALIQEEYQEARRLAESNLKICEEIGDVIGSTVPLIVLGHVAFALNDLEIAKEHYLRCLNLSSEVGFHYGIQTSTKYLGKVTTTLGEIDEAKMYLSQCLKITEEVGFVRDLVNLIYEFARLRVVEGKNEQAVELLAVVLQHPASLQERMFEGRISDSAKDLLASLEAELPRDIYKMALSSGEVLKLEEVVAELIDSNNS